MGTAVMTKPGTLDSVIGSKPMHELHKVKEGYSFIVSTPVSNGLGYAFSLATATTRRDVLDVYWREINHRYHVYGKL